MALSSVFARTLRRVFVSQRLITVVDRDNFRDGSSKRGVIFKIGRTEKVLQLRDVSVA